MPKNNIPNDDDFVNTNQYENWHPHDDDDDQIQPIVRVQHHQQVPRPQLPQRRLRRPRIPRVLRRHRPVNESNQLVDFTQEQPHQFNNFVQQMITLFDPNTPRETRNEYLRAMFIINIYHDLYTQAFKGLYDQINHLTQLHPFNDNIQLVSHLMENFALQYLTENEFNQ